MMKKAGHTATSRPRDQAWKLQPVAGHAPFGAGSNLRHADVPASGARHAAIFAVDVLECPRCGGRMRILAAIEDPSLARKILDCLDLPSRPPPVAPARRNRHLEIAEL